MYDFIFDGKIFGLIVVVVVIIKVFNKLIFGGESRGGGSYMAYKKEIEESIENQIIVSPWDYWETMKAKKWDDLTKVERDRMLLANIIIADDVGVVVSIDQLIELLKDQLPVTEPNRGLTYPWLG